MTLGCVQHLVRTMGTLGFATIAAKSGALIIGASRKGAAMHAKTDIQVGRVRCGTVSVQTRSYVAKSFAARSSSSALISLCF